MLFSRRQVLDEALAYAAEIGGAATAERHADVTGAAVLVFVCTATTVWFKLLYRYVAGDANQYDVSERVNREANDYPTQRAATAAGER